MSVEIVTYANKSQGMFEELVNNEFGVPIKVLPKHALQNVRALMTGETDKTYLASLARCIAASFPALQRGLIVCLCFLCIEGRVFFTTIAFHP